MQDPHGSSEGRRGGAKKGKPKAIYFFSRHSWILSIPVWTPNPQKCQGENRQTATFPNWTGLFPSKIKAYLCCAAICWNINLWEKLWELQRGCNKRKMQDVKAAISSALPNLTQSTTMSEDLMTVVLHWSAFTGILHDTSVLQKNPWNFLVWTGITGSKIYSSAVFGFFNFLLLKLLLIAKGKV